MEKNDPSVESSDGDIRKLVGYCFRNYKEDNKIRTRKLALKNAKYFGQLQKFSLHHNLSGFDLITMEIKLNRSN